LIDTVDVLGKVMGIDQKAVCQTEQGVPSTLHDEFVWVEDAIAMAGSMCEEIKGILTNAGIHEDGGIALAKRLLNNGHDDQNNYLYNGRDVLMTMVVDFYPPASYTRDRIMLIAQGVNNLCSGSIQRLMTPREGCTSEVNWYVSQRAKFQKHMAAVGGQIGMFLDGSNKHVATVNLGFSEDG
jgi:hypothetical protein